MKRAANLITVFTLVALFAGSALATIENPVEGTYREAGRDDSGDSVLNGTLIENPVEGTYRETEGHAPADNGDSAPWIFGWLWTLLV